MPTLSTLIDGAANRLSVNQLNPHFPLLIHQHQVSSLMDFPNFPSSKPPYPPFASPTPISTVLQISVP